MERNNRNEISGITNKIFEVWVPGFLVCDDGVGCIFASLLKPSRLPLIASKASSRLFSPVCVHNNRGSRAQKVTKMGSGKCHENSEINRTWRDTHLGFDTAEQPQLLFLLLKLSSFPVLLQHLLLLLQTFSKGYEE